MRRCPECGRKIDYYAETCPYCMAVIVNDGEYAEYFDDEDIAQIDERNIDLSSAINWW